jgi:hypothetical protein
MNGQFIEDPFAHDIEEIVKQRVLCPCCKEFVFEMWPGGWDGHSGWKCKGLAPGEPEERKAEYKRRYGSLFR